MVRKAETQVFDLPNDDESLSTDIARPCDLLDNEESLVSADVQRSLYLIARIPNYAKAYIEDEELDKVMDDEVEGGGNDVGEEGGDAPATGGGESGSGKSGGGDLAASTSPRFRSGAFVFCGPGAAALDIKSILESIGDAQAAPNAGNVNADDEGAVNRRSRGATPQRCSPFLPRCMGISVGR